ncbi:hypothetical protein ACMHYB_45325 [Sorangium sp. So ce1128]
MKMWLLIAGVLALVNAVIAAGMWSALSKHTNRPRFARTIGSLLGAATGAWSAGPQLEYLFQYLCDGLQRLEFCGEPAGIAIFFIYPFSLPVTTGLATWLLAEIIGGRTSNSPFTGALCVLGAAIGAALVFLPLFFIPGVWHATHRPILDPLELALSAAGALLVLAIVDHSATPLRGSK